MLKHIHYNPCAICRAAAAPQLRPASVYLPPKPQNSTLPQRRQPPKTSPPKLAKNTTRHPAVNTHIAQHLFRECDAAQDFVSDDGLTTLQLRERDFLRYLSLAGSPHGAPQQQAAGPFQPNASLWKRYVGGEALTLADYDRIADAAMQSVPIQSSKHHEEAVPSTPAPGIILVDTTSSPKQQQFLTCLAAFDSLMNQAGISYFICCGTALGITRESRFIPHDNDIDVGIIFEPTTTATAKPCTADSDAIVRLLGYLENSSFLCFDCLGELEKGLEVRLRHNDTGVLLDINLYYNDTDPNGVPFVWCATHYADSTSRKHGMYRYRHAPFVSKLKRITISSSGSDPLVHATPYLPPIEYLEEYFGADWRVPKAYTYEEGLRGEYKNIIAE